MLEKLKIKNVALINEAVIYFHKNLNIISGETGAGKSVTLDSLNLILGAKTNKALIKEGEDFLEVIATFININIEASKFIEEILGEVEDCIIISRKIYADGKNEIKLNGNTIPLNILKTLGLLLISTHSQNENLTLINKKEQLKLVDNFSNTKNLLSKNKQIYDEIILINQKISELNKDESLRARELDLLNYQIEEIENANISENEENELKDELIFLKNSEKIVESVKDTNEIYNGNYNSIGLNKALYKFKNNIEFLAKYNKECENLLNRTESIEIELEDIFQDIQSKFDLSNFSENRLDEIEARLEVYKKLHSKYGRTAEDILNYLQISKQKQDYLLNFEQNLNNLLVQKNELMKKAYNICEDITNLRRESCKNTEKLILQEVKELSMPNARLEFKFSDKPSFEEFENSYSASGFDDIELIFSANLGESPKPLNLVASGGEISRLMLAIKTICSYLDCSQTLVFDEIDTGISGEAGINTSKKLAKISRTKQVIAVSHLLQICAMADQNILVKKIEENNSTHSSIICLNNEKDEIIELTRFLSADNITDTAIQNAKEIKNWCNNFKNNLK